MSTEIKLLNKWLELQGRSITGQVIYRIIWSEDSFERRHGVFNDFTPSGLFIRQAIETRLVHRYNYIKDRWIFEKWAPGSITANPETPDAYAGDYIPIYVFEDSKGNYLTPNRKVVEFIINFMNGKIKKDEVIDEKALEEKEIAYTVESFDDHPGYFKTSGEAKNAVAYSKGLRGIQDFKGVL